MYIWLGINVDDQLKPLKESVRVIEKEIGFANSNLTMPLHISLKMPFQIDNLKSDEIIKNVSELFEQAQGFEVATKEIEKDDTIVWIRMEENKKLNFLHDKLDDFLLAKYDIPLHEYDSDYKFHTTLFMNDDVAKISKAFSLIKGTKIPKTLLANHFAIGTSSSGDLGTYKIIKEIIK